MKRGIGLTAFGLCVGIGVSMLLSTLPRGTFPRETMAATAATGTMSYRVPQSLTDLCVDGGTGTSFTVISGSPGLRTLVWDSFLATNLTGSSATVTFNSYNSTTMTTTAKTGAMPINAFSWDAPVGLPGQTWAFPKFATNAGDDLVIVLGASGTLTGQIKYTQQ